MIKPVDKMTEAEWRLFVELELTSIKRRQTFTLAIVGFIAASVGGVVIPRLVTFLLSGISQAAP